MSISHNCTALVGIRVRQRRTETDFQSCFLVVMATPFLKVSPKKPSDYKSYVSSIVKLDMDYLSMVVIPSSENTRVCIILVLFHQAHEATHMFKLQSVCNV